MATATQDDILIIQDETETSSDDFSFSFDFNDWVKEEESISITQEKSWEKSNADTVIDITESKKEGIMIAEEESIISDFTLTEGNEILELNNDKEVNREIGDIQNELQTEVPTNIGKIDEKANEDTWLDFSALSEEVESKSETLPETDDMEKTVEQTEVQDLNSILSGTITKLNTRKKSIADDTDIKKKKASELKAQIESLESQVLIIESEITSLWLESEKIDSNITQLESMKLDPVKEHNSRRSAKK